MSLSTERLEAMLLGMRSLFEASYGELVKDAKWRPLVLEIKSEAAAERYNWLGSVPAMHEWVDEREIRHLLGEEYTILNKNYSAALEVDRNDLEDDKLGLLAPRIRQLAERAAAFPNKLVFSLLDAGDTAKTFDGTAFFKTTRKIGESANINNKLTGAGVTADNIRTDIAAAVVAMAKYQDDRGDARGRGEVRAAERAETLESHGLGETGLGFNQQTFNSMEVPFNCVSRRCLWILIIV
ncbi:MAG: Mu-like prophage major head subunit gpT family protein [Dehalococcoidia bacterium]|nr:Mu-like prophage major head subunit gpT family protein [Dehalococcoidia bacterium]